MNDEFMNEWFTVQIVTKIKVKPIPISIRNVN
jgi:hypothetical protein